MSDAPEPDKVPGAPHPRDAASLFGQGAAEADFLDAFNAGRLHHAWLISGLRGVGKATLAWRMARFLLATPEAGDGLFGEALAPDTLDVAPDHPVARRMVAGAEPGFSHIIRRVNDSTGRLRNDIVAENVRDLNRFLQMSRTDGGRRVVLIDSADEMNMQAANALLKMLEEPPERTTFLLVSHQPARLLPTIRSRCRDLRLSVLGAEDMARALAQAGVDTSEGAAVTELSGGSVGEAVRLINLEGLALYRDLIDIMGSLPALDRARAGRLSTQMAARGAEERLDLFFSLTDLMLARMARSGATGLPLPDAVRGEGAAFQVLAPSAQKARDWAALAQDIGARATHGRAVNLDPAALVLDTVLKLQSCAKA
ncbi:MAG: DNA polymerase III subunit delta' [Pseudomonadota bacterium]